jgi:hypothetical protein
LTICVRRLADLPVYARQLVEHLAASELPSAPEPFGIRPKEGESVS